MSILHEIVGTIKADQYGYIYDADRTLKDTVLRDSSYQNIFKFLEIRGQNYAIRDLREVSQYNDWIKVEPKFTSCSSISRMEIKVAERTHSYSVELRIKARNSIFYVLLILTTSVHVKLGPQNKGSPIVLKNRGAIIDYNLLSTPCTKLFLKIL